jgi:hypothetical protein
MTTAGTGGARQALLAAAIAVAVAAHVAIHADAQQPLPWAALAAAALVAATAAGRRAAEPAPAPAAPAARTGRGRRLLLGALTVAAAGGATTLAALDQLPVVALLLWLASAGLGALAVRGWQATPAVRVATPWRRGEVVALLAVLALAALARVLWLDTLPRAIFGDEPRVGMYLANVFGGDRIPNFFRMGWNTWPVIGLSLQGLFAPVAGLGITTLRLSSALLGTLGVLATYLLARELSGPRLALLAACLFAICRTAIDFSRLGITHAQILFLEPLALFHLWRAINGGRAVHWWMAGVATGWCLFSYNAGQLVPLLVAGWLGLAALARPARLGSHWRGGALLAAGFALTVLPYALYVTDAFRFGPNWGQFTIMARNRQALSQVAEAWRVVGAGRAGELLGRQIWLTWLGFGVLPGAGYNLGYRGGGMLDDVSAALFVLGLAMALRRVARGRDAFVPYWWLATAVAGGIATADPPATVRLVGLLPALAILAAVPLDGLIASGAAGWRRDTGVAVAGLLLLGAGYLNWQTYFVELAATVADPNSELARVLRTRPPDQRAVLLGAEHHLAFQQELYLIEFPGRVADELEVAHALPLHRPVEAPLTLVLGPTQETQADYIRSLYPGAVVTDVRQPNGALLFRAVDLTPEDVRPRTGLTLQGAAAPPGAVDPFAPLPGIAAGTRLTWTGQVYWPSDRPLGVGLRAAQPTVVQVGDAPPLVASGDGTPVDAILTLPRGWQPIRIEETAGAARALELQLGGDGPAQTLSRWQLRPDGERQGLRATYTIPTFTEARETVAMLDPQINAFLVEQRFPSARVRTPFRVEWRGALRVDTPGTYRFDAVGSGPYRAVLDGEPLFAVDAVVPERPEGAQAERSLVAGLHPIEVHFASPMLAHTTRRIFQLFWTPPGGTRALIPPTHLVPAED